jgi:hypothetical protein
MLHIRRRVPVRAIQGEYSASCSSIKKLCDQKGDKYGSRKPVKNQKSQSGSMSLTAIIGKCEIYQPVSSVSEGGG